MQDTSQTERPVAKYMTTCRKSVFPLGGHRGMKEMMTRNHASTKSLSMETVLQIEIDGHASKTIRPF